MNDNNIIDFREIRPYEGDRRKGFEELICQLAQREKNSEAGVLRRVEGAGGDGGVEAYWPLEDGTEHGYQAKYFLATKDIDWSQIDKSVKAALEQHPKLTTYTIAIACDLTDRSGKLGKGKTGWEHWETHKSTWQQWAYAKGMTVEFLPWTKSELTYRLVSNTANRGLVLHWFNACLFDDVWFQNLFKRAKDDLGERFQPEDHVEVMLSRAFAGLARSPAYLSFLSKWFGDIPGLGNLSSALRKLNAPFEEQFKDLQDKCTELRRISESIQSFEARPLPLADWQRAIRSVSDTISSLQEWMYSQGADGNESIKSATREALGCLYEIGSHLDHTPIDLGATNPHEIRVEADLRRVLVVVGKAGSGKSHLFADTVASSLNSSAPAILLLGQHFPGQDIRREFLSCLDLAHHDFDKVLQALNAAGEAARKRLIILLDALNDAQSLRVWPDQLAGFISDILRHEWLALGISLRTEYEDHLLPEAVKNNAARVTCRGIQSPEEQEKASIQYFVKRGITRPAVPWLAPEFSNFLFLKTCCDALQELGIPEFPRGRLGSLQILEFHLESVYSKLRKRFPSVDIPKSAVTNSIRRIAELMAKTQSDYISSKSATDVCEAEFGYRGPPAMGSWFGVLMSEGVFRLDHIFHDHHDDPFAHAEDVYRFTYQHFSDHLIVQALLKEISDIDGAFQAGGPLRFLVEDDGFWRWSSLWSALAVQIPEKFAGKELAGVLPDELDWSSNGYIISEAFEHSILWRSNAAFTDQTLDLFNSLSTEWRDPRCDILIRLATLRDHPWNAELLDRNLQHRPLPERDAFWTVHINHVTDDDHHPLWELIRWSLTANLEPADTETLRLAAITLAWVFTSSNRPLRDTATKALTAIFANRPRLIPGVLERFQDVDDLYVMERVCAAILGAITRGRVHEDDIKASEGAVYRAIFARETPHLNIHLRDYARSIIDYAAWRGCLPDGIDIEKCKPPYRSQWPLSEVAEQEVELTAEASGGKQILLSACNWDFARYEVQPMVHHLTDIPLNQPRPLNAEERERRFLVELASWNREKQEAFAQLKLAVNERTASLRMETRTEENFSISWPYSEEAVERARVCQEQFTSLLDSRERRVYEDLILPALMPDSISSEDRFIPKFDAELAKRWITKRAYDYGWNDKRFPHDRRQYEMNREQPKVERIGKKYQWLALSEFVARLTDNVWVIGGWPKRAMVYNHPADWLVRDIEPSFLTDPKPPLNEIHWWQAISLKLGPIQDALLPTWPFQGEPPNRSDWMDVVAPNGTPWLLLYGFFSVREDWTKKSIGLIPFRRDTFVRVSTILIEAPAVEAAISKLKGRRLADPTGHDTLDWTDGPFLCEYPWRNTWRADCSPYEDGNIGSLPSIRYIRPVARHRWESPLDTSLQNGASLHIPHPWMGDRLGLRPNLDSVGEFVAETDRETVFIDPTAGMSDASAALIDKERFFGFLKEEGLECLWIVAGERNAWPSGDPSDYACRSFASVYRWTGKKWVGNKWHKDRKRRSNG